MAQLLLLRTSYGGQPYINACCTFYIYVYLDMGKIAQDLDVNTVLDAVSMYVHILNAISQIYTRFDYLLFFKWVVTFLTTSLHCVYSYYAQNLDGKTWRRSPCFEKYPSKKASIVLNPSCNPFFFFFIMVTVFGPQSAQWFTVKSIIYSGSQPASQSVLQPTRNKGSQQKNKKNKISDIVSTITLVVFLLAIYKKGAS